MRFDCIYINNCTGKLNHSVVDATSITPVSGNSPDDITQNLPTLLPSGNHPRFILNGPCLWLESWSDSTIKDEKDHIEFYLYEVLCVWQINQRYNSPIGIIAQDCIIKEFDMIETWCSQHNKTFTIYTNEYRMLDGLQNTRYANWPIICLDTFCLGYGYPGHTNSKDGADTVNIYKNIEYKFNCFTYRWDQHRMLLAGFLHQNSDVVTTHYHKTAGVKIKWPFGKSRHLSRLINGKNSLNHRVPLSVESHTIDAVDSESFTHVPINDEPLLTDALEPFYLRSFCSVVCETNYEYPWGQISEKTINAARYETPFIIAGGPGSLELCRQWGLKTFNQYWSESYDSIIDPVQRLDAILDIIIDLQKKSVEELTEIKAHMAPILLHNRNLFRTGEIKKNIVKRID